MNVIYDAKHMRKNNTLPKMKNCKEYKIASSGEQYYKQATKQRKKFNTQKI